MFKRPPLIVEKLPLDVFRRPPPTVVCVLLFVLMFNQTSSKGDEPPPNNPPLKYSVSPLESVSYTHLTLPTKR